MDDKLNSYIYTLCEEIRIFKMLKENSKTIDSFEISVLDYLNNSIKAKKKLLGLNKKTLEEMFRAHLKNKTIKEK